MVEIEQKRYADDITVQELVRLRVENTNLREQLRLEQQLRDHALALAIDLQKQIDRMNGFSPSIVAALQQKESE